jgi:PST family polysaccharide transporter
MDKTDARGTSAKTTGAGVSLEKPLFPPSEKKRVLENILSLGLLQGANYLLPLVSFPYLARVLGAEKFGLIMFAQSLIAYFNAVTEYGFNLSATREIAISRADKERVSRVFSEVIFAKLALMISSFFLLLILLFTFEKFGEYKLLYLLTFGAILGQAIMPNWLFQGMEQMKFISALNISARAIFLVLIFLIIKKPDDFIIVPLLNALGMLTAGIVGLVLAKVRFGLSLNMPSLKGMLDKLRSGWNLFVSTVAITLYRNSNVFLLGLVASYNIVGYYAIAEKIVKAVQSMITPVTQSLFPFIGRKFTALTIMESVKTLLRLSRYYFLILLTLSVAIVLFQPVIARVFLPGSIESFKHDIIIMSVAIVFGGLSALLGLVGLINLERQRDFTLFVVVVGLVNLPVCLTLSYYLQDIGSSLALLISELLLFTLCSARLRKIYIHEKAHPTNKSVTVSDSILDEFAV